MYSRSLLLTSFDARSAFAAPALLTVSPPPFHGEGMFREAA